MTRNKSTSQTSDGGVFVEVSAKSKLRQGVLPFVFSEDFLASKFALSVVALLAIVGTVGVIAANDN